MTTSRGSGTPFVPPSSALPSKLGSTLASDLAASGELASIEEDTKVPVVFDPPRATPHAEIKLEPITLEDNPMRNATLSQYFTGNPSAHIVPSRSGATQASKIESSPVDERACVDDG